MHEMLNQSFGVEIEMYLITRAKAAQVVAESLSLQRGALYKSWHVGGCYDAYEVRMENSRSTTTPKWLIERDSSIIDSYDCQVELVTPILHWDDMPVLQQVLRDLRKAGARSDPGHLCGIHVHVDGEGHTARSLHNLVNLMASHEQLLQSALALNPNRVSAYARPVDPCFLRNMSASKPQTLDQVRDLWYEGTSAPNRLHYHPSRYHMLNLHSFFQGKGIEFRLFQFDRYNSSAPRGRRGGIHAGQLKAFVQLCLALSYKAKTSTRCSCKVHVTDNPRYAMRCWLLRLGFIGDEFATARAVSIRRLAGDCAFRHGRPTDEVAA